MTMQNVLWENNDVALDKIGQTSLTTIWPYT